MTKATHQAEVSDADRSFIHKALLFEVAGKSRVDQRNEGRMFRIAALSLEEVIRYMRATQSDFEITELKIIGQVEVLSSSEHVG